MSEFGSAKTLALGPRAEEHRPMLAAMPMQYVFTSQVTNCMVS